MATKSLSDVSKIMRGIDFAMLSTKTDGGVISSRPMSNNSDVEYDGDSFFFTTEDTRIVTDIETDPDVALTFSGDKGLIGKPQPFIAVEGNAELIRDKEEFKKHWQMDLERWFAQGVETPDLVLIKVHATRLSYWDGEDHGEVVLPNVGINSASRWDREKNDYEMEMP